jgi:C4-dicarboxylate-specific signal transduction histidine kinase
VISQTSDRISKIVKSLQTLSQKEEVVSSQRLPLFVLIDEALSLSPLRSSHQGIVIHCNFEGFNKVFVSVNPVQFSQVLVNLFNNAFHAISKLEDKWIEVQVEVVDTKVLIDIVDSGAGLSTAAAPHVFEPFFTTKEVGIGTGLGLSLSRRMIEKQQGTLDYLAARKNTTFRITLPYAIGD